MIQMNQCFNCGKTIQDEDLVMKNVRLSILDEQTQRHPFHKECWKEYHAIEMKKNIILGVGLFVGLLGALFVFVLGFYFGESFSWIPPLIALGSTIAVLIGLGITYYRIKK